MPKWDSVVYSRTYEVDFRFIAIPEGFTAADQSWLWEHIRVTLQSAEKLSDNPRWSIFRSERYCVFGVTCMARELVNTETVSDLAESPTEDFQRRPLYLFAGYVTAIEDCLTIPSYADINLHYFSNLYRFVHQHWMLKSYQARSQEPIRSEPEFHAEVQPPSQPIADVDFFALNFNDHEVLLWADSLNNRQELWEMFRQGSINCNAPTSLCLGLESSRDVLDGLFLNATVREIVEKQVVARASATSRSSGLHQSSTNSVEGSRPTKQSQFPKVESSPISSSEAVGALLGAALTSRVTGLLGSFVGGGIGWIVGGWIAKRGIGGAIAQRFRKSAGRLRFSKSNSRNDSRFEHTSQEGIPQGFRKKNQSKTSRSTEQDPDWF